MASKILFSFLLVQLLSSPSFSAPTTSTLFREYIGAEFNGVKFSNVPINPHIDVHFILSFAIDYTISDPSPTNGDFNIFWDTDNLTPSSVSTIKSTHNNVKVALSLGGDSVGNGYAYFNPSSVDSWVNNAVSSLTKIIKQYNLDECMGQLLTTMKKNGVVSFASIAPFAGE
ncbi:uncharacterized protein A4U43_C03F5560 [Asparagus officinalis]|uniref:GH18 domain-containing protein n=1 Tax=Asparagus officinalis TaxID=4686 RepID=A0A5P1F9F9_ASPOF|nr:uncharacterized protein A4U43_C03F5560 [Asparagus officinalis]